MQNNFDKEDFQSPLAEINITPLVDVMLVLLVILLITAPIMTNSLNLDLATAKGLNSKQEKALNISVTSDNKLLINDIIVDNSQIKNKLTDIAKQNPQILVNLRIDKNVEFSNVANILSIIQELQFNNISLITKQN